MLIVSHSEIWIN